MEPANCHPHMIQAWAFACGVRKVLDKAVPMNMKRFPHEIWVLHRRLHHRFLRQQARVATSTTKLSEYQQRVRKHALKAVSEADSTDGAAAATTEEKVLDFVCLLTSSSDESEGTTTESDKE